MLRKPINCDGCPLQQKGLGFVPDQRVNDPEYIFIGEAPGKNEVQQGKPFVGQAGHVLKAWLMKAVPEVQIASERNKITLMNTLRCLPPEIHGRPYPKGEEKDAAERQCRQYDNFGNAKTVVLFGESSQRCWFGEELEAEDASDRRIGRDVKGVMGRIGRVYEKLDRRWVLAPHPAWILRQPALVEHGQQSLRIAANTERVAEVDYVKWEQCMTELLSL